MICPKCGNNQVNTIECEHCGLIFAKYRPRPRPTPPPEPPKTAPVERLKETLHEDVAGHLIDCAVCHQQISSAAKACPHCGHPVRARGVQTVEQTGKEMKTHVLLAAIVGLLGLVLLFTGSRALVLLGGMLLAIGFWWYIIARAIIWWRYK